MLSALLLIAFGVLQADGLHATRMTGFPGGRRGTARCCSSETLPSEASDAIPPEKLAAAWSRDEKAKELSEVLKGCTLYLVGLGPKKSVVGSVLARRLTRYRCYDVSTLMASTYQSLAKQTEPVSISELVAAEPLEDVEQLATAVLQQVQPYSRSVIIAWDGAVSTSDYAIMQQGLVVHIKHDNPEHVALPATNGEEVLEAWQMGHSKADVEVNVDPGDAADDVAFQVGRCHTDRIAHMHAKHSACASHRNLP